jgi:N-acyl-D-amino-acid deacylase
VYDLIVGGGALYGTGASTGVRADVGVSGDRIVAIADLTDVPAAERIDAAGRAVSPG